MNEHEEKLISAFIAKEIQHRYKFLLNNSDPKRRRECIDRLNHCGDLDPKYVTWLPRNPHFSQERNEQIATLLRQKGSPNQIYVLSCASELDGRFIALEDALNKADMEGWGTIISCIPGELAYYFDEEGERRAILERKKGT